MHDTPPRWTVEEDAELARLWAEGKTSGEIGKAMGKTRNAVIGRARRHPGCQARPSPLPQTPRVMPQPARLTTNTLDTLQRPHGVEIIRKPKFWSLQSPDRPQAPADTLTLDVHDTTTREREYRNVTADKRHALLIPVGALRPMGLCQWIKSKDRPWVFCNCERLHGYSYCAGHKAVAFRSYVSGDAA